MAAGTGTLYDWTGTGAAGAATAGPGQQGAGAGQQGAAELTAGAGQQFGRQHLWKQEHPADSKSPQARKAPPKRRRYMAVSSLLRGPTSGPRPMPDQASGGDGGTNVPGAAFTTDWSCEGWARDRLEVPSAPNARTRRRREHFHGMVVSSQMQRGLVRSRCEFPLCRARSAACARCGAGNAVAVCGKFDGRVRGAGTAGSAWRRRTVAIVPAAPIGRHN